MPPRAATRNFASRTGVFLRSITMGLIVLLITACSPVEPTPTTLVGSVTTTVTEDRPAPTVATTTTTEPLPEPPAVEAVFPQNGAAAPIWDDEAYGSDDYADLLARLADAGAGWVSLVPTWYQDQADSSSIYIESGGRTATDESLTSAIEAAHSLGLQVVLKPHVDIAGGGGRISIVPADFDAWFSSYKEMILHYAAMAETHDVAQFVVGTELRGTSGHEAEWRDVIADVRDVYSGPITYAANHDEFVDVAFWDALDFIGVDAYFPLSEIPTTIISDLRRSWNPIVESLAGVAEHFGREVVFTEIGYPSQQGATIEPYNPNHSEEVSEEEQAAALQALIESLGPQPWFGGFHWWMWFEENDATHAALSYMPEGKLAGALLEEYWANN